MVKRAIDDYHRSCASTVGAGKYVPQDFTFESFEKFLYGALKKLQKNGPDSMKEFPEATANPLHCTKSTNRCMHATHAYTGIPCAAYCKSEFKIKICEYLVVNWLSIGVDNVKNIDQAPGRQ